MKKFLIPFLLLLCPLFAEEEVGSDVHVFFDTSFKNDYITPRGLLVTNTGLTVQILSGAIFDVYKCPKGLIKKISLIAGIWNDIWTDQNDPYVGSWNELDWFVGFFFPIAEKWKFEAQYVEFISPPHHFHPEQNAMFTLSYDDTKKGDPFAFRPYTMLFWAISGDSTVVTGRRGGTYYFEVGFIPTYEFKRCSLPITFTAPTWITVGPSNFWNGGPLGLKCENKHFGVFSTGLLAKMALKCVPLRLGRWNIHAGVQYYYLINNNLLEAQKYTIGVSSISHAHRNVVVANAGFGFEF